MGPGLLHFVDDLQGAEIFETKATARITKDGLVSMTRVHKTYDTTSLVIVPVTVGLEIVSDVKLLEDPLSFPEVKYVLEHVRSKSYLTSVGSFDKLNKALVIQTLQSACKGLVAWSRENRVMEIKPVQVSAQRIRRVRLA
jgi:hypothetical protein